MAGVWQGQPKVLSLESKRPWTPRSSHQGRVGMCPACRGIFTQIHRVFAGGGGRGKWRTDSATKLLRKAFEATNCLCSALETPCTKLSLYIWLLWAPPPLDSAGEFRTLEPCAHPDFRARLHDSMQQASMTIQWLITDVIVIVHRLRTSLST